MTTVYVGVGSNIERRRHIEAGIVELKELGTDMRLSTLYECEAVGFESASFYNLVLEMKTDLNLTDFSRALRTIERRWGREENAQKFAPRTLDLDIILFGEQVCKKAPEIPRADIYKYAFVIQPLFELCSERVIPNDGRTVAQIHRDATNLDSLSPVKLWFDY